MTMLSQALQILQYPNRDSRLRVYVVVYMFGISPASDQGGACLEVGLGTRVSW